MSSVFNNLVSGAANFVASKNMPEKVQKALLATGKEGPMAVLPPEIAVTGGRSLAAAKRSGFLEFQERFIEEILGAAVWLGGVKVLGNVFDKYFRKFFPQYSHLDPSIGWDGIKKKAFQSVELTAAERFAPSAAQKNVLTGIKISKLGFSVGLATFTAAIIVPWLNKVKTDWIIKKFYTNKPKQENTQPQQQLQQPLQLDNAVNKLPLTSAPPAQMTMPVPAQNTGFNSANNAGGAFYSSMQPNQQQWQQYPQQYPQQFQQQQYQQPYFNAAASIPMNALNAQVAASPVQFGGLGEGISKALQTVTPFADKLGHGIQQTNYGEILSVDVGLTGGRAWSYGKRSPFEAIEIVFRDVASLYFYIMFTPHAMKAISRVIEPLFKADISLNGKAAQPLAFEITKRVIESQPELAKEMASLVAGNPELQQAVLSKDISKIYQLTEKSPELKSLFAKMDTVGADQVREIILGSKVPALSEKRSTLMQLMTRADRTGVSTQLATEARIYGVSELTQPVDDFLKAVTKNGQFVTTDDVQSLISAIKNKEGEFASLTQKEQSNLMMSVKQAFRQQAGVTISDLTSETAIKNALPKLFEGLTDTQEKALISRVQRVARQGAFDQANALARHHINIGREFLMKAEQESLKTVYDTVVDQADEMADWLERAVSRQGSVESVLQEEITALQDELTGLTGKNKLGDDVKGLIQQLDGQNPSLETLEMLEKRASEMKGQRMDAVKNLLTSGTPLKDKVAKIKTILYPEAALKPLLETEAAAGLKPLMGDLAAVSEGNLGEKALKNIKAMMETIEKIAVTEGLPQEKEALLQAMRSEVSELIAKDSSRGRLFSLYTSSAEKVLGQYADEVLKGGIINDGRVLSEVRGILGELPATAREFVQPSKVNHVKHNVDNWLTKYLEFFDWKYAEGVAKEGTLTGSKFIEKTAKYFNLANNSHGMARVIALIGASLGLGWLVPKVQYAITKKLTGKNEHPGFGIEGHGNSEPKQLTTVDLINNTPLLKKKASFSMFEDWQAQYAQKVPASRPSSGH